MNYDLTLQQIVLTTVANLILTAIILIMMIPKQKENLEQDHNEKRKKPAHEKALQNKFIIGIHLAFMLDGFDWEFTWHGIKYTREQYGEFLYPLEVYLIFGDWEKQQYDKTFVELQINKKTLNIEKADKFHWQAWREMFTNKSKLPFMDGYLNDN